MNFEGFIMHLYYNYHLGSTFVDYQLSIIRYGIRHTNSDTHLTTNKILEHFSCLVYFAMSWYDYIKQSIQQVNLLHILTWNIVTQVVHRNSFMTCIHISQIHSTVNLEIFTIFYFCMTKICFLFDDDIFVEFCLKFIVTRTFEEHIIMLFAGILIERCGY